jgi:catechol 2,3-dioxygenase-like lactoylglutathione lyase family enzyme
MTVRGLDHVALTVADVPRTLDFFRRALGAEVLYEDLWRAGKIPVVILQLGASRLSIHEEGRPAKPHARAPAPGSADVCFRWDGPLDAAAALLAAAGVRIEEGPVARPAADGQPGASLYFRDPDGNCSSASPIRADRRLIVAPSPPLFCSGHRCSPPGRRAPRPAVVPAFGDTGTKPPGLSVMPRHGGRGDGANRRAPVRPGSARRQLLRVACANGR